MADDEFGDPITWCDITAIADGAAKELGPGHMLHADTFNLSDSMSALEMMDPKMDAGVLNEEVKPADECFEAGLVDLCPDAETTVAVMDRIMARELTWQSGCALAQTVFTCLYMHRPEEIKHSPLRAYCQCVLKTCSAVKRSVARAEVFEEEDFSTNTGGFGLLEELGDSEVTSDMTACEEAVSKEIKAAEAEAPEVKWLQAIVARMRLRRALHSMHLHLSKGCKGIGSAKKSIAYALVTLESVKKAIDYDESRICPVAFQAKLNVKMMAPSPPRTVQILTIHEAIEMLSKNLKHLMWLCNTIPTVSSLVSLQTVLSTFTLMRPSPTVVPRSYMRLLVYSEGKIMGHHFVSDWVKESMVAYKLPEELLGKPEVSTFIKSVGKMTWYHCNTLCHNLGRQRRRMVKAVDDWVDLQIKAEELDHKVFPLKQTMQGRQLESQTGAFFSSWILDQVLEKVIYWLNLGFHLHLYAWCEYSMMYWYLDYFYGIRINLQPFLFYPKSIKYAHEEEANQAKQAAAAKGGKKKQGKDKGKADVDKRPEPPISLMVLEMQQAMCRGVFRMIAGMEREGSYYPDALTQASMALRFHRRFCVVFRLQSPQALLFEHYTDSTDSSNYQPYDLYAAAGESFHQGNLIGESLLHKLKGIVNSEASTLLDSCLLSEVEGMFKVAHSNAMHAVTLARASVQNAQSPQRAPKPAPDAQKEKEKAAERRKAWKTETGENKPQGPYPCDDPLVQVNDVLNFSFSESICFPVVLMDSIQY
eukprot:CAMPEP_0206213614 /NCGR_PEP_ID=MMETSP0047_2-20121206/1217_1 /ASSEMBLY_ACC=CAM_ASM_000192 /TAXON_ID=195065 /ORGANISM="Chroomonas mesostigmatica_cf, Strain CCMP1168" /LENGTH=757 /DNA_ID=CAMNT_0053635777 /DNA_START=358 /DNA_END=2631 /DNA_ORIENTATION=+